jgi:hypothetical protein
MRGTFADQGGLFSYISPEARVPALENFDRFRSQVEAAASRKFDSHGFDAEKYEGMPAIRLTTDDLT